jgi:type IV pilus assembly protein PilY1
VFVISNPVTGRAQWAYAADTGGNIYRISGANANSPIGDTYPVGWTMTRIAALGCDDGGTCSENRKFLYAPDVVVEPEPNSGTHILLIGSGDREKPVLTYDSAYETDNYFYMVIDRPTDSTWLTTDMGDCSVGEICMDEDVMLEIGRDDDNPTEADLADKKGWYLELAPHEQVVTSAITVFGGVTFSTHIPTVPDPGACSSDLGTANVYNVRYRNAAPSRPGALNRYEEIEGGGLPPSPVAGQVRLDDGTIVPFIIGADPSSPLEGGLPVPPSLSTQPKSITYWYIEKR